MRISLHLDINSPTVSLICLLKLEQKRKGKKIIGEIFNLGLKQWKIENPEYDEILDRYEIWRSHIIMGKIPHNATWRRDWQPPPK